MVSNIFFNSIRKSKHLLILIGVIFIHIFFLQAQDNNYKFVNQWPINSKDNKTKNVKEQIKNFILGSKNYKLSKPISVLVIGDTLWNTDQGSNSIFQFIKDDGKIPHFIEKKKFNTPSLVGICAFNKDKILFTDSYFNKIFIINVNQKECKILNDSLKLIQPTGIAYSKIKNEIWVVETGAHRIVVLNDKGEIIKKIGTRGNGNGEFNFPSNIWIDNNGPIDPGDEVHCHKMGSTDIADYFLFTKEQVFYFIM